MQLLTWSDAHVHPEDNLDRFDWLGRLIIDRKPEVQVQLGDFLSVDSLSHWDMNKRLRMEGRRYWQDIDVGREALRRIAAPINTYNQHRRENKLKQYKPRIYWFEGNHEQRVGRYVEQYPELEGHLDVFKDLGFSYKGIEWVPYPEYRIIEGITMMHAPRNAVGPISSQYVADKALNFYRNHIVFGHNHRRITTSRRMFEEATPRYSISAGCFMDLDNPPEYMRGNCVNWTSCVLIFHMYPGGFDVEEISLDRMRRLYG